MNILRLFKPIRDQRDREVAQLLKESFSLSTGNIQLYKKALRHKSAARNIYNDPDSSNERLEFLGDAILDAIVADYLYAVYPDAEEGDLTKMKSRIVSRNNLNKMARAMHIEELIETDSQAIHARGSIAGNAIEAVFGAIYLDRNYAKTKEIVLKVLQEFGNIDNVEEREVDFKSRLYEEAHRIKAEIRFNTRLHHEDKGVKTFISKVMINSEPVGEGMGTSKKKAEQKASREGLIHMERVTN